MNTCPFCDARLKERQAKCPKCGKPYWRPDSPPFSEDELLETEEEEEGCLPILFWPLIISLCVTICLIVTGFVFQLVARFQNNQIKTIWILGSFLVGGLVYLLFVWIKKRKS